MSTTGSSIRSSVLKHWRNSSIALGRSGSKREKSEKAAKRQSVQVITTAAETKSPEPQVEAPAVKPEQPQANDNAATNGAAPETKIVSLHVTVHIAPENVEKFLVAFKAIFDLVSAEPECLFFEVYRSVEEPGKISWVENWSKDTQWLMEHQLTKPYYKEYFEVTEPMFLKPREAVVLEPVGPGFTMIKTS